MNIEKETNFIRIN